MPEPALAGATAAKVAIATAATAATDVKTDDRILARKGILERVTTDDLPHNSSVREGKECPNASAYKRPAPTSQDRRAPGQCASIGALSPLTILAGQNWRKR